jgi:hypothetical protein
VGEPVLSALAIEDDLLCGVFFDRVVMAQLLDDSAVSGVAGFDGVDSEEGSVASAYPGHSYFDCHDFSFRFVVYSQFP